MTARVLVLSVVAFLAACSDAAATKPAPAPVTPPGGDAGAAPQTTPPAAACPQAAAVLTQAAAKLEAQFAKTGATGGSVAILCGGEITSKPVGVVRSGGEPVKETTRFQFASITKTFTAVTALSLKAEGKVAFDAALSTYVPFVKVAYPGSRPINLADLLTHTAGYAVDIPDANYDDDSLEGWFKANGNESPWSPPGAVFNYSNLGFSLAGLALQRATGTPFGALVEERVFAKAGMTRATMSTERTEAEGDFAYGNSQGEAFPPTGAYFQSGQYGPMGGAWGSAADLAAFGKALATKSQAVIPSAAWQSMIDAKGRTTWPGQDYGYGLIIDSANPNIQGHDGSAMGFSSSMSIVADKGFGVFMVANGEGVDGATLTREAFEALGVPEAPIDEPQGKSDDWIGTYEDPIHLGTVTIAKAGAGYSATWKGSSRALSPDYGDTAYYPDPTYGELGAWFWRDKTGKVEWLVTTEGHAKKIN